MNFLKMGTFHIEWFSYKRTLMLHFIIDGFDLMKMVSNGSNLKSFKIYNNDSTNNYKLRLKLSNPSTNSFIQLIWWICYYKFEISHSNLSIQIKP